ncbi:MAG: alanine racemase [Gammaproteobacteria bacterium]|nr:alanine racemase [Gammaproteobacteria bacterium]
MTFGARALIRLDALRDNLKVIRSAAPGSRVMAVVKANAYGHGMVTVARTLDDADSFGVARLPEAVRLHESGIEKPIVLLAGVLTPLELDEAMRRKFEIVVHCVEQIELLEAAPAGATTVWLKFDTGMNRLGFAPDAAASLIDRLRACEAVAELRLMSHLASADELDNTMTDEQVDRFRTIVAGFTGAVSIANTPGMMGWPQIAAAREHLGFTGDHWIRPGLALFGISPFAGRTAADLGLKPVMQFEARLIAVKPLHEGARVGYRGRYRCQNDTTLGIISAGYGDGYSRHFRTGTPILINDRRAALIGNVSMDMLAVDLGPDAVDKIGDIATLWGDGLPVEEVAPWADAIPYELVCGVMNREDSEVVAGD